MSILGCEHEATQAKQRVCRHIFEKKDGDHIRTYTGQGKHYDLLCPDCAKLITNETLTLLTICTACFNECEQEGYWDGIVGMPEILQRDSTLHFIHRQLSLPELSPASIVDIQPIAQRPASHWLALTDAGVVYELDLETGAKQERIRFDPKQWEWSQATGLQVAPRGDAIAITETRGNAGMVLDMTSGRRLLTLQRDGYHTDVTPFPAAFFVHKNKTLFIYATAWNRLDIYDVQSATLLTERGPTEYAREQQRPPHYLDYFHGRLSVSPDQQWIADDGWVWHPVGSIDTWDLRRWLDENPWESEDGESKRSLVHRFYYWNGPICWIDNRTLAVWGYGRDDLWLIPAVILYDVISGEERRWFAGPQIQAKSKTPWRDPLALSASALFFDRYLIASSGEYGTSVWDIDSGECVHRDTHIAPIRYHPQSREWLSLRDDGSLVLSRLAAQTV